ncbi:MAG TPA: patatin-like phospholipase family protein, partial [Acidimicrobiales bacterium]
MSNPTAAAGAAAPPHDGIVTDPDAHYGYRRPPALQAQFEQAAATLLTHDGWTPPGASTPKLMADLALEGGGVKGIGIVGAVLALAEAGYHFSRVAGTSAGAIAAALIAAISKQHGDMAQLKTHMGQMDFTQFMRGGILRPGFRLLGKVGLPGEVLADLGMLTHHK